MKVPRGEDYEGLLRAFRNLDGNPSMAVILKWVKTERDAHDKANRIPGNENKASAAQALSTILDVNESARTKQVGRQETPNGQ